MDLEIAHLRRDGASSANADTRVGLDFAIG
jgi:hypothetical protein